MATKKTSQAQQTIPTNPFLSMPGLDVWRSMMDAQRERFEQLSTELERMEKERHDRTLGAIDEMAKLMKSSVAYQQQLAEQWRTATAEAAKKGAELVDGAN